MGKTLMNRFPQHFHERAEPPLLCHQCEQPLTDDESDHFWNSHLHGQGDPYCFDCASRIDLEEITRKPEPWHWPSTILFACALGFAALAIKDQSLAGFYVMGAFACGTLGIMARICKW
jgi:hypothetical protein